MSAQPPPPAIIENVTLADSRLEVLASADESQWRVVGRPSPMSTHTAPAPTTEDEQRFHQLAEEWISETAAFSDPVRIFLHKSLFKIIGMGEKALPLVLKEVEKNSAQWFVVLDAISPIRPVKAQDEKNLERVRQAWIEWGRSEGLI